jgi:TPR repeat protein
VQYGSRLSYVAIFGSIAFICYGLGSVSEANSGSKQALVSVDLLGELMATVPQTTGDGASSAQSGKVVADLERDAARGSARADYKLALLYESGEGVPQNRSLAFSHYLKSATLCYRPAETAVGINYYSGVNVTKNIRSAAYWLDLAAHQGSAQAQAILSILYANGDGVRKNYKEAYFWGLLSQRSGKRTNVYGLELVLAESKKHLSSIDTASVELSLTSWQPLKPHVPCLAQ